MLRQLDKQQWEVFFDRVSRGLREERVDVEVASEDVGDQLALEGAALQGLTYDPNSDELEVEARGLEHVVAHPREIYVESEEYKQALRQVVVVDGEGRKQFIRLQPPLVAFPP